MVSAFNWAKNRIQSRWPDNFKVAIVMFLAMNHFLDGELTYYGLEHGLMVELNPLMATFYDWGIFRAYKWLLTGVILIAGLPAILKYKWACWPLGILSAIYQVIVWVHIWGFSQ